MDFEEILGIEQLDLKALNDVKGIKNVVINEGSGFDF